MPVEREYVVQYRRVGTKKWTDSHVETFPSRPNQSLVHDEFMNTASDLVHYSWKDDTPRLRGDFEVRVVLRELVEREIPLRGIKRFNNQDIIAGVLNLQ